MRRSGSGLPAIVIGGFFIFVSFMMAKDRLGEISRGQDSAGWPAVQGEVLRSSLIRRAGSTRRRGRSRLVFDYRYQVAGTEYEGDRVAFTANKLGRIPDSYPKGATIPIHYDPADPAESVVEPGVQVWAAVMSLAPFLLFAVLGVGIAGWGVSKGLST